MVTKPAPAPAASAAGHGASDKQFPEFPPRDDMNNSLILDEPGWQPALRRRLCESHPDLLVISEMPMGWSHDQRGGILVPDLLIAFDVDAGAIIRQRGYAIDEVEKPPEFVLEIASIHTARNDERGKRAAYARYGVIEYWRFDDTGGRLYISGLAGDRLGADGSYHPIRIHRLADGSLWGHSQALNLDLCWEDGRLRWYDPAARRYLDTYDEAVDGWMAERGARMAEQGARILAEGELDTERAARLLAEGELDTERAARLLAQGELDTERAGRVAEQAARRAAESEAQRLQEVIRRLREGQGK